MKTDEFFYQIFRRRPLLLFELLGLEATDVYQFESIEVKHTHKRIDGFLSPQNGKGPVVFLELQGYLDRSIYWRAQRSVATWFEQHPQGNAEFLVVILFLDKSHDPGLPHRSFAEGYPLLRATLAELFGEANRHPRKSPLIVLEPLLLDDRAQLKEKVRDWVNTLNALNLSEEEHIFWVEQLSYAILQRFTKLTSKEIQTMLNLTPWEETTVWQEAEAAGRRDGYLRGTEKGRQEGELIGSIRTAQRLSGLTVTPSEVLQKLSLEELQMQLTELISKNG